MENGPATSAPENGDDHAKVLSVRGVADGDHLVMRPVLRPPPACQGRHLPPAYLDWQTRERHGNSSPRRLECHSYVGL